MGLPDFVIMGAPKAGSTALHDALAQHPQLVASSIKEPKYFLCGDRPPDPRQQRGPGDRHSAQEWVWRRSAYERLFDGAPAGKLRFESTAFYLWSRAAHRRIAKELPHAKLIAVVRDPVDRAFSNWTHLYADGLEPIADFRLACRAEPARIRAGFAPFWRYLELGRYGEQLAHLFSCVDREQVMVVRYGRLVDHPAAVLDEVCSFLGVSTGQLAGVPSSNLGRWVRPGPAGEGLRRGIRVGAALGAYAPPQAWRIAQRPLLRALQENAAPRPRLDPADRVELMAGFADDVRLLSELTGEDYTRWLSAEGRGAYAVRKS